jgi:signal transduction histidine kinase
MNNIVKHAKASNVTIELINENNFVLLTITDDGNGFDQDSIKSGMGLKNMKSRAELHNGTAIINTSHKNGCKLTVQIPLMN